MGLSRSAENSSNVVTDSGKFVSRSFWDVDLCCCHSIWLWKGVLSDVGSRVIAGNLPHLGSQVQGGEVVPEF